MTRGSGRNEFQTSSHSSHSIGFTTEKDVTSLLIMPFHIQGAPYFYTKGNSQTFDSFGAVPNADSQPNGEEGSPINLLAVLLGTGVAVLVTVLVVIGGVIGAVWYKRRQHRRRNLTPGTVVCDTEKVYLIRKN